MLRGLSERSTAAPKRPALMLLAAHWLAMLRFRAPRISRAASPGRPWAADLHRPCATRQGARVKAAFTKDATHPALDQGQVSLRGPWKPALLYKRWWDLGGDKNLQEKLTSELPVRVIGPRGAEDKAPWPVLVLFNGFLVSAARSWLCFRGACGLRRRTCAALAALPLSPEGQFLCG